MVVPGKGFVMDASRANCRKTCEEQLVRLKVPAIQLWTLRGPVDRAVPLEETMQEVKVRGGMSPGCLARICLTLGHNVLSTQ